MKRSRILTSRLNALRIAATAPSTQFGVPLAAVFRQLEQHQTFPVDVVKHNQWLAASFATAAAAGGADLAQLVLQAEDEHNMQDFIEAVKNLDAEALPSVVRAAVVRKVADKSFHDALSHATIKSLPDLTPADLCSVVQGLAGLEAIKVFEQLADTIVSRLQEFNGDMLGAALHAFGHVNYFDADLMEAVVEEIAKNPTKFSADNVADVVYAYSKCGFCDPQLVQVVQRAGEVLLNEADHDSGAAIVNIVDAYSRVGCQDPDVVDTLITRVAGTADKMAGPELAKFTTAIIRLGYEDDHMIRPLLDALVPKLDTLPPASIVKIACALGELGVSHQVMFDKLTDNVIPSRIGEFHNAGMSKLVQALNKLGYYNAEFMKLIQQGA